MFYRILHLSDYHWRTETQQDQAIVVNALVEDLAELVKERPVNKIVFTGDLVYSGSNTSDFEQAKNALFAPVCQIVNVGIQDIIICPGNHDIDRALAKDDTYLELGLQQALVSRDALNAHIDKHIDCALLKDRALARMSNYVSFAQKNFTFFRSANNNYANYYIDAENSVGFAIFNTAWRSLGEGVIEKERLLLGERIVDLTAKQLVSCNTKIAIMHHPLEWLQPWDAKSVSTPMFENFDLVLFGHAHDDWPGSQKNPIGECILAQAGCLYETRDYYNGYQLIDVGTSTSEFIFTIRRFFDHPRRKFGANEAIAKGGRKEYYLESKEKIGLLASRHLAALKLSLDSAAASHIAAFRGNEDSKFDDIFEAPVLASAAENECHALHPKDYKAKQIAFSEAVAKTGIQVILGARETGKTTLMYKIAKEALKLDKASFRIPVIIDFKKYNRAPIERLVKNFFSRYEVDFDIPVDKILNNYKCLFLIDNVSCADAKFESIVKLIESDKGKLHDWFLFLDDTSDIEKASLSEHFANRNPDLFIHSLNRSQARHLICRLTPTNVSERAQEIVLKLIQDNNLPRSGYMVSLLSVLFINNSLSVLISEANLVDKMIDILLEKADTLNVMRSSSDFGGLNIILQETAAWINEHEGILDENTFIQKLAGYLRARGILTGTSHIYETLIKSGVIRNHGGEIDFRYRAFEAFFHARHIIKNKSIRNTIFYGSGIIKYAKEYSFICDMTREDFDVLSALEEFIRNVEPEGLKRLDKNAFFDSAGTNVLLQDSGLIPNEAIVPTTPEERDEAFDLMERSNKHLMLKIEQLWSSDASIERTKDEVPPQVVDIISFFQAFGVWGRALLSLDFVELSIRKPSLFRLLCCWSRLCSWMSSSVEDGLNEVEQEMKKENKELTDDMRRLIKLFMVQQMPLRILFSSFEHIGPGSACQLLLDAFDESDLREPEAVGLALLLIVQRPDGWTKRIYQFLDTVRETRSSEPPRAKAKVDLIFGVCVTEYMWKSMKDGDRHNIRAIMHKIMEFSTNAKIVGTKFDAQIRKFDLRREMIEKERDFTEKPS